jgi:hypothetical protein
MSPQLTKLPQDLVNDVWMVVIRGPTSIVRSSQNAVAVATQIERGSSFTNASQWRCDLLDTREE